MNRKSQKRSWKGRKLEKWAIPLFAAFIILLSSLYSLHLPRFPLGAVIIGRQNVIPLRLRRVDVTLYSVCHRVGGVLRKITMKTRETEHIFHHSTLYHNTRNVTCTHAWIQGGFSLRYLKIFHSCRHNNCIIIYAIKCNFIVKVRNYYYACVMNFIHYA